MDYDTLFERHKNPTPSTCAVDPAVFLQRIREFETTLPEGSVQRNAWAAITAANCLDGFIQYTISGGKISYSRAIGATADEVITNALAIPAHINITIPASQMEKISSENRFPCEFRRRIFGIYDMFLMGDRYVVNSINATGVIGYINLLSLKALGYSSPMRIFAHKVLAYSNTESDFPPKASFLVKLQDGMGNRDFMETLALGMYDFEGTLKHEERANKLNQWCPELVPALSVVRASISDSDIIIALKMMRKVIEESVKETLQSASVFQLMTQEDKNTLLAQIVDQSLSRCVPTTVMLRAARREFNTMQEYIEARDAEHTSAFPEEHSREYEFIQEALAGSE